MDAQSLGLISTVVVSSALGLLLWVSLYSITCTSLLTSFSLYSLSYDLVIDKFMLQESGLFGRSTFTLAESAMTPY